MRGIKITVARFGSATRTIEVEVGATVGEVLQEAGLYDGDEQVRINGDTISDPNDTELEDGDRVMVVKGKDAGTY